MINASWQAAHDRFHAHVIPQLQQRGLELGAAARAGNADAQADLLEAAFQRYCQVHPQ